MKLGSKFIFHIEEHDPNYQYYHHWNGKTFIIRRSRLGGRVIGLYSKLNGKEWWLWSREIVLKDKRRITPKEFGLMAGANSTYTRYKLGWFNLLN